MKRLCILAASAALAVAATSALADIKVGVTVSATGPAASLGITERNVFEFVPRKIGDEDVTIIILDDGSDPTAAVRNARKFTNEDKVDLIIGSTTTPASIAVTQVAAETKTPMFAMGAGAAIVNPMDDAKRWAFKAVHNDSLMVEAIVGNMVARGVKTVGYIGFADATGEGYWKALQPLLEKNGIKVVANETYARTDTSVAAQALRIVASKPDAVFIAAFGSPAALPQTTLAERGYTGQIYQTHGVANQDFLRLSGASAEGTILPVGPLLVAEQLGDDSPVKATAMKVWQDYGDKFGADTRNTFIANAYDAYLIFAAAAPKALETAKPGTPEFRAALRDAIEATKGFAGSNGVYTLSPEDHVGLGLDSVQMVTVSGGKWKVLAD
ncbi:MAG: ABC transporter substrate-binding protein [Flavobacteriaceae bacterium]